MIYTVIKCPNLTNLYFDAFFNIELLSYRFSSFYDNECTLTSDCHNCRINYGLRTSIRFSAH